MADPSPSRSEREATLALHATLMTTIEAVRQAIEDQDNLAALTSITKVERLAQQVGNRIQAKDESIDWATVARLVNFGLQMLNSFVD